MDTPALCHCDRAQWPCRQHRRGRLGIFVDGWLVTRGGDVGSPWVAPLWRSVAQSCVAETRQVGSLIASQ
jgi:hypothetical protein